MFNVYIGVPQIKYEMFIGWKFRVLTTLKGKRMEMYFCVHFTVNCQLTNTKSGLKVV